MHKDDLSRPVKIDISACGAIAIREPGSSLTSGYLPLFSTDTTADAETLRERLCRRERGADLYRVNEPPNPDLEPEAALDELDTIRDRWRAELHGLDVRAKKIKRLASSLREAVSTKLNGLRITGDERATLIAAVFEPINSRTLIDDPDDELAKG